MARESALKLEIVAKCSTTKARVTKLSLPHYTASTPMFMAVGTQGSIKGLSVDQLREIGCQVILGNTYHLALKPGAELLKECGGLHSFMKWDRGLLTDSGGFQMVSLVELSKVTEDGVNFKSPRDGSPMLLTPEKSIEIQNAIGADVIMQLDDVVSSLTSGPRVEEAMWRSIRWLDRCISAHQHPERQNLFAIIQGGLDPKLRKQCISEMVKRDTPGYAIGGLSGGEEKDKFWQVVSLCTDLLPEDKPRYCMGVGYAEDLVVCSALGVDMYDCVYPTRTARFSTALTNRGTLSIKKAIFSTDFRPIEPDCACQTCKMHTRAHIHHLFQSKETVACHLLSVHNISFQMQLMSRIRLAIIEQRFPEFVKQWMFTYYKDRWPESKDLTQKNEASEEQRSNLMRLTENARTASETNVASSCGNKADNLTRERTDPVVPIEWENGYPKWIVSALKSVNILLQ